tara:strand:- start:37523 stop:38002 length:480 start_codon:yes stop_codon:yes gene_type:complete
MLHIVRRTTLAVATAGAIALSPMALSHLDDKEMQQSYRQSFFAMLAMNFGPIASTVKGEIPWDQARMQGWADDLAKIGTLDVMRGFAPGSDKGTTRAKPEIWDNMDDFKSKMDDMTAATAAMQTAVASGDKAAVGKQLGALGDTCKACHDEYKSKDYLY